MVSAIRFYELERGDHCTASCRDGSTYRPQNQPHIVGQVIIGGGQHTRYSGIFLPPSEVGLVSEDRCKYCLAIQAKVFERGYRWRPDDFDCPSYGRYGLAQVSYEIGRKQLVCPFCLVEAGGAWDEDDEIF